ncbi:MAG TPA: GAF domain-containing protein [Vicinamibacterales bacterium]|nr:GAF domain-containing protein [Vicinamibacterales bacterium]
MFRRSVRIACLVAALLATAGLGYRVYQDENVLSAQREAALATEHEVAQTAELLLDLRASLHAYVAPSQGLPFWGKRAQEGIETLRQRLTALDAMVSPAGGSLKQSIDAVSQLAAAERRARTYVSRDEMQLAGDVIFTEVRDILAAMTADVRSVRDGLQRGHDGRATQIRSEQTMLAGGALAVWIAIALLFLPTEPKLAVQDPAQWRNDLRETLKKPVPTAETLTPETPAPQAASVAETPAPTVRLATLRTVSEICADLSSLADPGALQGALERVSETLDATGLIVWVASNDGSTLSAVATHGFDPKIVYRIGKVGRDSANLTAAAFRDNASKVSAGTSSQPAAMAVPMCGPTGPTGVLSIELKAGQPVEDGTLALASIIAAQLATLTMPIVEQGNDRVSPAAAAHGANVDLPEAKAQSA